MRLPLMIHYCISLCPLSWNFQGTLCSFEPLRQLRGNCVLNAIMENLSCYTHLVSVEILVLGRESYVFSEMYPPKQYI